MFGIAFGLPVRTRNGYPPWGGIGVSVGVGVIVIGVGVGGRVAVGSGVSEGSGATVYVGVQVGGGYRLHLWALMKAAAKEAAAWMVEMDSFPSTDW